MPNSGVLSVDPAELRAYGNAVRTAANDPKTELANTVSALQAGGPALGGAAAAAADALRAAWSASDAAYIERLEETADRVDSSASLYESTDGANAQAVQLAVQSTGSGQVS